MLGLIMCLLCDDWWDVLVCVVLCYDFYVVFE